ncbi:hypothetical protein [Streptomyces sp. NPDC001508]|uniref:hypothetical protein n=1 Tax=Streptomyces sp. NPDC001508 TaxID=3154656 RepID=UPI00331FBC87
MPSPCDPQHAPVGDVGAALMMIDSRLKAISDNKTQPDAEQQALTDQITASLGPSGVDDLLDGACTLIYMFMQWLRMTYSAHGKDVIECVVPNLVATMRMMPRSVRPETIPTTAGLLIAAGTDLSPNLWRKQYGYWTEDEMNPLEATAFLLAEHINQLTDDRDFATRLIIEALSVADEG